MKERLIGAVVLVGLGVWLIPWVLDGPDREPETLAEPLALPADQETAAIKTQVIDLDARSDATERYAARPAGASDAGDTRAAAAVREAPATGGEIAAPEPVSNPPAASEPLRVAKDAESKAAEAPAATASSLPAEDGFMVQLGSFSEEANARRLAERVATFGYEPQISTYRSGGRDMHRVRIGPHATRNAAEAAASSLAAHGFPATVVNFD